MHEFDLTKEEFDELFNYSFTMPTRKPEGFFWKRFVAGQWYIGEIGKKILTGKQKGENEINWYKAKVLKP